MEYVFFCQVHMLYIICVWQITWFSYLDEGLWSKYMGCVLTRLHNTAMAFIPPFVAGRTHMSNKKLHFQYILMLTALRLRYSSTTLSLIMY